MVLLIILMVVLLFDIKFHLNLFEGNNMYLFLLNYLMNLLILMVFYC